MLRKTERGRGMLTRCTNFISSTLTMAGTTVDSHSNEAKTPNRRAERSEKNWTSDLGASKVRLERRKILDSSHFLAYFY